MMDDSPEWTADDLARARNGGAAFKARGPGWQTAINDVLRAAVLPKSR